MAKKEKLFEESKKKKVPFNVLSKKGLATLAMAGIMMATPFMLAGCTDGKDGLNGKDGTNGLNGSQWYTGEEVPTTQGVNGDFYYDTDDYKLYQKENGTWVLKVENFGKPGDDGEDGTTPSISINSDGYWVINGEATAVKAEGDTPDITINSEGYWVIDGNATNVKAKGEQGIPGENGASWFTGKINPVDEGKTGDFYLNTQTYDVFKKDSDGWQKIGNIRGKDGQNASAVTTPESQENIQHMTLGNFVNKTLNTSTVALTEDNNYMLTMDSIVAVPYDNATVKVTMDTDYRVAIYSSNTHTKLDTGSGWLESGDTYAIPTGHIYMRVVITHKNNMSGNVTEVPASSLEEINLNLEYDNNDYNVILMNTDAIKYIDIFRSCNSSANTKDENKYAVITHATDVHGDTTRLENVLKFSEYIGSDFNIISGDLTAYEVNTGYSAVIETINKYPEVTSLLTTGNHDVKGLSRDISGDLKKFNELYKDIYERNYVVTEVVNGQTSTWYYGDDATHKLRVICLDNFERLGAGNGNWQMHYNQSQINFFINALKSLDEGWSVIVTYHSTEVPLTNSSPTGTTGDSFYNSNWRYTSTCEQDYIGTVIRDIVDAFIGRENLSQTYTQANTYQTDGVTTKAYIEVNADFTDAKGTFVAHMTGHFHNDAVCEMPGATYKQIVLNQTCTTANIGNEGGYSYLSDLSDLPRSRESVTQDAFNTYIIDTDTKTIKIVRVGSNLTTTLTNRRYMSISYENDRTPQTAPSVPSGYIEGTAIDTSDSTKWVNATVSANGISSTASTKRLSYNVVLDVPEGQKITLIFAGNYHWAVRSGESEGDYPNNQYWYKAGETVTVTGSGKMMFIFRKVTDLSKTNTDSYETDISFADLSKMGELKWYYEPYTSSEPAEEGTLQELSLDSSKWVTKGMTDTGLGSENAKRLTCITVLDVPESQIISITFTDAGHYQWAIRSGESEGNYPNNQYWYNSGDTLTVTGSEKMMIILRKVTSTSSNNIDIFTVTITPEDAQTSGLKLYFY